MLFRSAYKIMAQLNAELEENGIFTCQGRVSRKYFDQRFGLESTPPLPKKARTA